jgi:hypothetical protein
VQVSGPPLYIKEGDQLSLQDYITACDTANRKRNVEEHAKIKKKKEEKEKNHLNDPDTQEFNRFNTAIFEKLKSQIKKTINWDDDHPFIQYLQLTYNAITEYINDPNNINDPNKTPSNKDIQRSYIQDINRYLNESTDTPLIMSNEKLANFLGKSGIFETDNITINASEKLIKIKNTNIIFVFEIINDELLFSIKQMEPNQDYSYNLSDDYIKIDSIEGDYSKFTHSKYFFIFKIPEPPMTLTKCIGDACRKTFRRLTGQSARVNPSGGKRTRKQMYSARSRGIITLRNTDAFRKHMYAARSRGIITLRNADAFRKQKKTRKQMHSARSRGIITLRNADAFRKQKKAAKGRHK